MNITIDDAQHILHLADCAYSEGADVKPSLIEGIFLHFPELLTEIDPADGGYKWWDLMANYTIPGRPSTYWP
jgi:hypothetical protein